MKMRRVIPALPVRDIPTAVAFYRDRLGFTAGHHDEEFAILTRDDVEIHLWAARDEGWRTRDPRESSPPVISGAESFLAGSASCRIETEGVDALYEECRANGVLYAPDTVIEDRPWGSREFPALDLERNLLTFYEPRP